MPKFWTLWNRIDRRVVQFMDTYGVEILRVSLAIVFIWFGLLKVFGRSPVYDQIGRAHV